MTTTLTPNQTQQDCFNLNPHQIEGISAIRRAFKSGKEFLLADEVGCQKTRQACVIAKEYKHVLVVAPLSTFAGWNKEADVTGLNMVRPTVHWPASQTVWVNYDQLHKWPEIYTTDWDLVIWDECHYLRSTKTRRFKAFRLLKRKSPKILYMSATPGQSPLDLAYLQDVIGFDNYWSWVRSFKGIWAPPWGGFKYRPGHSLDQKKLSAIVNGNPKAIRRTPQDIAGWPELQCVVYPVQLSESDRHCYEAAFDDWMDDQIAKGWIPGQDVCDMVATGQFRKRLSELKTNATIELAWNLIEQGKVVVISCEFVDSAREIRDVLSDKKYNVELIEGATFHEERSKILQASAKDQLDAIVFTIQEGINLQQMQDSHRPRIQINHDIRWSGIAMHQILGRAHRAGRHCLNYFMAAHGTIDEQVAKVVSERLDTIQTIADGEILRDAIKKI